MAQTNYNSRNIPTAPGAKVAIVYSKWHREVSEAMIEKCVSLLADGEAQEPDVHMLPGSLELPLAARRLARRDPEIEAIIAFGVIVRGGTAHFDMVKDSCLRGLERVMFEEDIPIIMEVLAVDSLEDGPDA